MKFINQHRTNVLVTVYSRKLCKARSVLKQLQLCNDINILYCKIFHKQSHKTNDTAGDTHTQVYVFSLNETESPN
jgi:hypothetical protein